MAALTTLALVVFIIEAQIPLPLPIPGAKLGLANTVTLFALFYGCNRKLPTYHAIDAFMMLVCRIILGAVFAGSGIAFIYSLTGGMLAFAAQAIMKRFVTSKQIWVCGATGAIFHNIGQVLAAMLITGTPSIAAYLPLLIIAGVLTGVITGLVTQFTLWRLTPQGG